MNEEQRAALDHAHKEALIARRSHIQDDVEKRGSAVRIRTYRCGCLCCEKHIDNIMHLPTCQAMANT